MEINAKKEFLENFSLNSVVAACITYEDDAYAQHHIKLQVDHTPEELGVFLAELKLINYDNGYGHQYLYGTVWLVGDAWATRGEYDGSEWWEHHSVPEIPDYLMKC